jgi:hypothetical protein
MLMITVRTCSIALGCLVFFAHSTAAQLRPLDPIDFRAFADPPVRVQVGFGMYTDQLASLAGVRGTLWEVGDFRATIRTGRIVMELGGVVRRNFEDDVIVAEPVGGATEPPADGKRSDSGDYRVATIVRLTSDASRTLAVLRFGTRLPTTNNRRGLDRDAIDFFATVGVQRATPMFALGAEAGLAINGTREFNYEQADVLVYGVTADLKLAPVSPFVVLTGHHAFFDRKIRGNEDLAEVRAGARVGQRRWLQAAYVQGLADASLSSGLQVSAGAAFGKR